MRCTGNAGLEAAARKTGFARPPAKSRRGILRFAATLLPAVVAGLWGVAGLSGCRRPPSPAETRPFRRAIDQYLRRHSMGMKIARFRDLEVHGNTARAVVSMAEAQGIVGVRVEWTFDFKRQNGRWQVVRRE